MVLYSLNNENKKYSSIYGEISSYIYEEKKSKFICYIFKACSVSDATNYIEKIKKNNYNAKHIVYIYSISCNNSTNLKFCDDGEPQGTGTKGIYEMLQKENISNICVIIVRYFGGILLGVGPLTRAYLNSFKGAYKLLKKEEIIEYQTFHLKLQYEEYKNFSYLMNTYVSNNEVVILKETFGDFIEIELNISKNKFNYIVNELKNIISEECNLL